jgi:hypothetical protein
MINRSLTFLFLIGANSTWAASAVVIVLQAPLLKEAKYDSQIYQYIRKGEEVYIPNELITKKKLPEFVKTFDRAGNDAYLPSKYIKPITNDEIENNTSIHFAGHDPTDYRIEEPIPSSYPYSNSSRLKASFSFQYGNNLKAPYDYNKAIHMQDFSTEKGARVVVTEKISFDQYDRFYFGCLFIISSTKNIYEFSDTTSATESRSMMRIGPLITFDAFSGRDWRITFGTGFTYNYHKTSVAITGIKQSSEERFFTGFSISPLVSFYGQMENVFPAFDIVAGTDINLYMGRKLKASTTAEVTELWNGDVINESMKPQATLFLGAQFKY